MEKQGLYPTDPAAGLVQQLPAGTGETLYGVRLMFVTDGRVAQGSFRAALENSGGVGLAAPQVGVLRRVVVLLDVNTEPEEMVELVNPEVIETHGEERVVEGCLSVPGVYGYVTRPTWAKIRAQDRDGNWFEREGEGIVAQCFCHETEHLDGHLFTEKVEEYVDPEDLQQGDEGDAE